MVPARREREPVEHGQRTNKPRLGNAVSRTPVCIPTLFTQVASLDLGHEYDLRHVCRHVSPQGGSHMSAQGNASGRDARHEKAL